MPSNHGGRRAGAGRKALPLIERKVKRSVTLSLIAIEAVNERRHDGEDFSTALDRILTALPQDPEPYAPARPSD